MWKENLNKICTSNEFFGERSNKGTNDKEIVRFVETAKKELCTDIPKQYIDFLKIANGIEFNGFIIYGIDADILDISPLQSINGFIENNKIWHKNLWQKKYIFFGDSNISWYVYDKKISKYCELSKPSGDLANIFDDIEMLLNKILENAIR